MPLNKETKEIVGRGDVVYEVTSVQLPAMKALKLFARLTKLVAPILQSKELPAMKALKADDDVTKLAPVLVPVLMGLDEDKVESLLRDSLKSTYIVKSDVVGGQESKRRIDLTNDTKVNDAFAGDFLVMLKVALFALQVNFRDFFSGVRSMVPATADIAPAPNKGAPTA